MDAVIAERRHLQTEASCLKSATDASNDKECVSDIASEDTDAYRYIWLSGDEFYTSDSEEVGTETIRSNAYAHEAGRMPPVECTQTCDLGESTLRVAEKSLDMKADIEVNSREHNQDTDNVSASDGNYETFEEESKYNYVLLSDKEDNEATADSDSTLTATSEIERLMIPPEPAESDSIKKLAKTTGIRGLDKFANIVNKLWNRAIGKGEDVETGREEQAGEAENKDVKKTRSDTTHLTVGKGKGSYSPKAQHSRKLQAMPGRSRRKRLRTSKRKLLNMKRACNYSSSDSGAGKTRHFVKVRRKSKQSDLLMQEAVKFLGKDGLTEANDLFASVTPSFPKNQSGHFQYGRASKRLAQKKRVSYQELMCGSRSNTSSSSRNSTVQDDESFSTEWTSGFSDDFESGVEDACVLRNFSGKKQKSLQAVQQTTLEKWNKIMPTPTSLKGYMAVKCSSNGVHNSDETLSERSQQVTLNIRSTRQSCCSFATDNFFSDKPEPRIVLEKLDTESWLENSITARNSVKYQKQQISLASTSSALASTSSALTSTSYALASTSSALASTSSALASTSSALTSTSYALASTSSALASTSSALASTSSALTSTSYEEICSENSKLEHSKQKMSKARKSERQKNANPRKLIDFPEQEPEFVPEEEKGFSCNKTTACQTSKFTSGRGVALKGSKREGKRFPCKYCGLMYSRPYIYMHQRIHRSKQLVRLRNWQTRGSKERTRGQGRSQVGQRAGNKLLTKHKGGSLPAGSVACPMSVASSFSIASPVRVASPLACRTYCCSECNYKVNSRKCLKEHQLLHQQSERITCDVCGVVFKHQRALKIWHTKNNIDHSQRHRSVLSNGCLKKQCAMVDCSDHKSMEEIETYPINTEAVVSQVIRMEESSEMYNVSDNIASQKADANNNTDDACEYVRKASEMCSAVKTNENANQATTGKTPVSSLSCVICDFVATSFEALGSHFIANHFLGSGSTDVNNNTTEGTSSTGYTTDVAGGFAKKYKAKKQKPVYAIINKQQQLSKKEHTASTVANECIDSGSENVQGSSVECESLQKTSTSDENNNSDGIEVQKKTNKEMSTVRKYALEGLDLNNNAETEQGASDSGNSIAVELLMCLVCQSSFPVKADLLKHLTRIHRLTNLCQLCYFKECEIRRFANPVSLRNHKLRSHSDDMVKCKCGAMLIDEKMLLSHLKKFKCDQSEKAKDGAEMVKCVCGKRFGSTDLLAAHKMKCRKRSHSEGSDSSSLSNVSPGISGSGKYPVTSPAYNTRSFCTKKVDDAGSSVNTSWSPVKKKQPRERKPFRYSMMEGEEKQVDEPDLKKKPLNTTVMDKEYEGEKAVEQLPEKLTNSKTVAYKTVKQSTTPSSKIPQGTAAKQPLKKKPGPRRNRPDAEGRYPCKVCRRRFKRPYLYVHQKNAHQRKQWVLVPTGGGRPRKGDEGGVTFRCGWCKFVAVHWRTVVYHHYSRHQEMELDVINMVTKPALPSQQQQQ